MTNADDSDPLTLSREDLYELKAPQERRRRKRLSRETRRWAEAMRLREYVAYIKSVCSRSKERVAISEWANWP